MVKIWDGERRGFFFFSLFPEIDYLGCDASSFVSFSTALSHDGAIFLSIVKELWGIEVRMSSGNFMQIAELWKKKKAGNHFPQHTTL